MAEGMRREVREQGLFLDPELMGSRALGVGGLAHLDTPFSFHHDTSVFFALYSLFPFFGFLAPTLWIPRFRVAFLRLVSISLRERFPVVRLMWHVSTSVIIYSIAVLVDNLGP